MQSFLTRWPERKQLVLLSLRPDTKSTSGAKLFFIRTFIISLNTHARTHAHTRQTNHYFAHLHEVDYQRNTCTHITDKTISMERYLFYSFPTPTHNLFLHVRNFYNIFPLYFCVFIPPVAPLRPDQRPP